jgi:hypothetical protein
MAIMADACTRPGGTGGLDPFVDEHRRQGARHARAPAGERQPRRRPLLRPPEPARAPHPADPGKEVAIEHFIYGQGDLNNVGRAAGPRAHPPGTGLTFVNQDNADEIWHTITACKAPCNKTTGIA